MKVLKYKEIQEVFRKAGYDEVILDFGRIEQDFKKGQIINICISTKTDEKETTHSKRS